MADAAAIHAPHEPVEREKGDAAVHMPGLGHIQRAAEVHLQKLVDLGLVLRGADDERAQVARGVRHPGVFPIDHVGLVVREHEVRVAHVVVAHDLLDAVGLDVVVQAGDRRLKGVDVEAELDRAGQFLEAPAVVQDVEAVGALHLGLVQAVHQLESPQRVGAVAVLEVAAALHPPGDLPALLGVDGGRGPVDAEFVGLPLGEALGEAVYDGLGALAGVAVHVLRATAQEGEYDVGVAAFDLLESRHVGFGAIERRADVAYDLRVHVLDELVVESLDLVDRVELEDVPLVIPLGHGGKFVYMAGVEGVQQHVRNLRVVVLRLEQVHVASGEILRPVELPNLEPIPIMAPDAVRDDDVMRAGPDHPFVRISMALDDRQVGLVDVLFERVDREVVVGRADEGVSQEVTGGEEGRGVVPTVVVVIYDDFHAELLFQIEEQLFHVADDNIDFVDSGLLELSDLALDENLALDCKKTLRFLIREGGRNGTRSQLP